jgi:hypothetical protein
VQRARLAAVALLGLAFAMPAAAHFHGFSWTGQGIALDPSGRLALAQVSWHGDAALFCPGTFDVMVQDTDGSALDQRSFHGFEEEHEIPLPDPEKMELIVMDAGSYDPDVDFHLHGPQAGSFQAAKWAQVATGNYEAWQLALFNVEPALVPCA